MAIGCGQEICIIENEYKYDGISDMVRINADDKYGYAEKFPIETRQDANQKYYKIFLPPGKISQPFASTAAFPACKRVRVGETLKSEDGEEICGPCILKVVNGEFKKIDTGSANVKSKSMI